MGSITVYALEFEGGEIYIGMTADLSRRLIEHRRRQSVSTRRYKGEFKVIHQELFEDYGQARRREKYLKSGAGRELLRSIRT